MSAQTQAQKTWRVVNRERHLAQHRAQYHRRKARNSERVLEIGRLAGAKWRKNHPGEQSKRNRVYRVKLLNETLAAYGGAFCACCGESTLEFLSIDHINGRAKDEPRRTGTKLYIWLRQQGWPQGYQVLCHNCNQAKGTYGVCPHKLVNVITKEICPHAAIQ